MKAAMDMNKTTSMNLRLAGRSVSTVLAALCLSLSVAMAQTASPREQLQEMVGQLQRAPSDQTLREKIIKLALTLDPKPAITPEAERFMARGQAALETAKEPGDFKDAAAEFEKATLAAPWLGNAYCNLGIVQDKAGDYPAAIRNLKLYLLATPGAADAKAVETLLYKIEFKQEKAAKEAAAKAKESSPEVVAAIKAKADEDWLKKLDGAKFAFSHDNTTDHTWIIDIKGKTLVLSNTRGFIWCKCEIKDRAAVWQMNPKATSRFRISEEAIVKTEPDGQMLTFNRVN
jgi:tetratricopeptide (TPR) repeat protein